jgi:hypothetical protein
LYSFSSFCFSSKDTINALVRLVTMASASVNLFSRSSCNLSRWLLIFPLSSRISCSIIIVCSITVPELFLGAWMSLLQNLNRGKS